MQLVGDCLVAVAEEADANLLPVIPSCLRTLGRLVDGQLDLAERGLVGRDCGLVGNDGGPDLDGLLLLVREPALLLLH